MNKSWERGPIVAKTSNKFVYFHAKSIYTPS